MGGGIDVYVYREGGRGKGEGGGGGGGGCVCSVVLRSFEGGGGGRVAGWDGRGKDTQAHYIIILHELALLGILLLMKALLSDGTRFILEIFHVLWC